ncbi:MAG: hypothetical protein S4CHLAM6_10000 [Chlamydiae bacterium]|nr:hypothetical protein [Chlamydiota bacterium]
MKLPILKSAWIFLCVVTLSNTLFAEMNTDQLVAQSSNRYKKQKYRNNIARRDPNTWCPYFMQLKYAEPVSTSFFRLNVGVGFLYFAGIRGNLETVLNTLIPGKTDEPLSGRLTYNRTPLFEAVVGRDIYRWLKIGLAYQHQGGIIVQTKPQVSQFVFDDGGLPVTFKSDVSLDAVMAKFYLMAPHVLVWKNLYTEPYLGLGVGPGWQTWASIETLGIQQLLRPKISANCVFTVDLGFKLRKAVPLYALSFTVGCKYNQWGQARSMGKLENQYVLRVDSADPNFRLQRIGLSNPLRIKTVYQFAPYVGVVLNF